MPLLQVSKSAVAAIAAAGAVTSLLGAFVLATTNCKQISDTFIAARSHIKFADHSAKIGYQHAVSHLSNAKGPMPFLLG